MTINANLMCCGLRELSGLSYSGKVEAAMLDFARQTTPSMHALEPNYAARFRYAIFSQARARAGYGERFAKFITDHKLGDVIVTTGSHINPNSGNWLRVWVWTVDHDAVQKWAAGQEKEHVNAAQL